MPRKRLLGTLDETGHADVVEENMPELKSGQVLVKVFSSLISAGTELRQGQEDSVKAKRELGGTAKGKGKPFGYQNTGEITGKADDVTEFEPGDRVACMGAGYAQHANYAVVPKNLCCRMPENVSYEEGAFAHLAATSLHAVRRGRPELGENALVAGLGLVGQMAGRLMQLAGARVMGWDRLPFRCSAAAGWGIDGVSVIGSDEDGDGIEKAENFTNGSGFDMAVVAFGGDGTEAVDAIKRTMIKSVDNHEMGRICIVGGLSTFIKWASSFGNLDVRSCARTGPGYHDVEWEHGRREYPLSFIRWNTRTNMECVLRLISEKKLDVNSLITHKFPLEEIDRAVAAHVDTPERTLGTVLLMNR